MIKIWFCGKQSLPNRIKFCFYLQIDNRLATEARELRRRTYTITESEIQTAIALIPTANSTSSLTNANALTAPSNYLNGLMCVKKSNPSSDNESNIVISGDEDEFDDVFMLENGELVKHDVNAILAALKDASELDKSVDLLDLPEPPQCFSDSYTDQSEVGDLPNEIDITKLGNKMTEKDANFEDTIFYDKEDEKPVVRKGPRITIPDITKSESIRDFEENEAKVVRGRRKPLYPGKKITAMRQNTAGSNKAEETGNKRIVTNNKVNGGIKKSINSKNERAIARPMSAKNSPSTKINPPAKKTTGRDSGSISSKPSRSKLPTATAKGKTVTATPTQPNTTAKPVPIASSSKSANDKNAALKPKVSIDKKSITSEKKTITKPAVTPTRRLTSLSKTPEPSPKAKTAVPARPSSVPAARSEMKGRVNEGVRKSRSGVVLPGVRMCADGAEVDGDLSRGRTVSPRAVLHRAAGLFNIPTIEHVINIPTMQV